jgi:hypothetical protein
MIRVFFGVMVLSLALAGNVVAQTCSLPNTLTNGTNADATQVMANFNALLSCINSNASPAPRSYLSGLALSTTGGSASFAVAPGVATSDDTTTSMKLAQAYAKTTASWAVGSGNGGLDAGSIANNTWYHVFLIERTDTGVVDVLISSSPMSPALPTGYTKQRRVGSIKTDGSGHWVAFAQTGDEFVWASNQTEVSAATITGTSLLTQNLSWVPPGVRTIAHFGGFYVPTAAGNAFSIFSPDVTSSGSYLVTASSTSAGGWFQAHVLTDLAPSVKYIQSASPGTWGLLVIGYTDRRGRDN